MSDLKQSIAQATKVAMKQRDKPRLGALRLISAEIKQAELAERQRPLGDDDVLDVLNRMLKQRKDALRQFQEAGRSDLVEQERLEIEVINGFLPEQLSEDALVQLIDRAIAETDAQSPRDMGKVMGALRGPLKGRADMGRVSARVKELLAASPD